LPTIFFLHVFIFTYRLVKYFSGCNLLFIGPQEGSAVSGHSFPVPPPQCAAVGLEKMLPPFPRFRITLGATRRDVRSAKAVVDVGYLPLPGPG
jgi:hypothetical protein